MSFSRRFPLVLLVGPILLSACQQDKAPASPPTAGESASSLADAIQVDPAKIGQPAGSDAASPALPPDQRSPAAIAAARGEAARLAGGAIGPAPAVSTDAAAARAIADAGKRLAGGSADCGAKARPDAAWATRVPAPLAPYPRARVIEAAGVDGGGCSLRVISFVTAVGIDDVLGYYHARVGAAGMSAVRRAEGGDQVLGGGSAMRAYMIYARRLANGLTEVDVLTSGS